METEQRKTKDEKCWANISASRQGCGNQKAHTTRKGRQRTPKEGLMGLFRAVQHIRFATSTANLELQATARKIEESNMFTQPEELSGTNGRKVRFSIDLCNLSSVKL